MFFFHSNQSYHVNWALGLQITVGIVNGLCKYFILLLVIFIYEPLQCNSQTQQSVRLNCSMFDIFLTVLMVKIDWNMGMDKQSQP